MYMDKTNVLSHNLMKKTYSGILTVLILCLPLASQAKVEHLLPRPQMAEQTDGGAFALHRGIHIVYSDGAAQCALLEEFFTDNGCALTKDGATVKVALVESIEGQWLQAVLNDPEQGLYAAGTQQTAEP